MHEVETEETRIEGAGIAVELDDPGLYIAREVSWMQFNDRVLQQAENRGLPLLERVKFCSIWNSNLDERFMVRVADLYDLLEAGIDRAGPDGLTPSEQLERVREMVTAQQERVTRLFGEQLLPQLAEHGIRVISVAEATGAEREELDRRFRDEIYPVLTPLAIGQGRPFPYISNLSLSLAVLLRDPEADTEIIARVKVPTDSLQRFIGLGSGTFVALEDVIAANLRQLFPGMEILDHGFFRVTRDLDYDVSDAQGDLLQAVEEEVRRRRFGEVVRLEVSAGMDPTLRDQLIGSLRLSELQVYEVSGLFDMGDLRQLATLPGFAELRDEPWSPVTPPQFAGDEGDVDVFARIRQGDILVHHPYESFNTSVERFVAQAVDDPDVLAIKQTVYRTSADSPLVPQLIQASERGKQAVCMVELKARFDEEANIQWARKLEEAGVHVVYGFPTLKTHAKCILVVRRERDAVRRYCHIGTGNYHPRTARKYTDIGLFTADPGIGADVSDMLNNLTGYGRKGDYDRVWVGPGTLRSRVLAEIRQTVESHRAERPARITLKMNGLTDAECIRALYEASQAGVEVRLNVRGICCLRPGVPGVSERISVVSVVGRFLEHSRIFCFEREGEQHVYFGSADLMPRNLNSRVELVAPIEDPAARAEALAILERTLADEASAWTLEPSGEWRRRRPADPERPRDVHRELMERAVARSAETAAEVAGGG